MSQTITASPWLTLGQLAERWHTTGNALHKRRSRGEDMPPAVRPGKALLFHISDVEEFEQQARSRATATS